ncbi:hypothetical protein NKH98_32345 [Mesorhizobium sp. M0833]|uniref:hypothetical protein n=1 Tax=Mesorhizobium sp. M0833 TaxID=2957009 RepID=UPI003338188F
MAGHPNLKMATAALLSVHAVLLREFQAFEKQVRALVRRDARARRLMSTPGVGPIVALTYRRDDGSGQTATSDVGLRPRGLRLARPHPLQPHQVVAGAPTPYRSDYWMTQKRD